MVLTYAVMSVLFRQLERVPRAVRGWIITVCGMICLFTPLLLWVVPTITGAVILLTLWIAAILVIYVMVMTSPDEYF